MICQYFYVCSVLLFSGFVYGNIDSHSLSIFEKFYLSTINASSLSNSYKWITDSNLTIGSRSFNNTENLVFRNVLYLQHERCFKDLLYLLKHIKSQWATQMLDSNGKLPSGVLLGDLLWIGKYDECIKVNVPKVNNETLGFHGMYCTAQWNISLPGKINLPMHEVPIKTSICLPDSCLSIDVKRDISHIIDLLYNFPLVKQYEGDLKLAVLKCNTDDNNFDMSAILFLFFLGLYLLLPLTGSFITTTEFLSETKSFTTSEKSLNDVSSDCEIISNDESLIGYERVECEEDQVDLNENNIKLTTLHSSRLKSVMKSIKGPLKCFCIFTNASQILNTESSKKQFPCLHGLRFFSMAWVILGHTYVHNVNYIDNYMDLLKGIDNLPFQAVLQGTFSVDTFFLIGGFLLGYIYLEEAEKRNGKINWPALCLHRFLRITPVYLFLIGFTSLIFKYLGSGPFWEEVADVATCKQYWWWNVLYINNFLPLNFMCLTWTWYLANDMQFFIVSSLILYVLWRWKYIGIGIFCSILAFSWTITWYLSSVYDVPPLFMGITEVKNYTEYQGKLILAWDLLYSKPYCRIGPHIIGILFACYMYSNSNRKLVIRVGVRVCGWCIAMFCSMSVIYGLYHVKLNSFLLNAYNAFGRSVFSLGIAWLIFCCLTGHAGLINKFLSYKLWIPLSRLTYCAYLFHPLVMNWYFQSRRVPLFFTHTTMIIHYFAFLIMSYGVAFIISIIFEAPLINLEKLIFKR